MMQASFSKEVFQQLLVAQEGGAIKPTVDVCKTDVSLYDLYSLVSMPLRTLGSTGSL